MPRPRRDGSTPAAPRKLKFTDGLIGKLKPEPKPYAIWDLRQPGLAVLVQPSGHRAFKFVYSFRSRPRWYHIGNAVIPVADARRLAVGVMLQVIEGKDPAAEKKAERGGSTFAELAQAYVERYARKKNKSWSQADKLVRKNLIPKWGKLPANGITRTDVKAMIARIAAPTVANQTLAAASAIFTWAIKEDVLKTNPCQRVERNAMVSRERILSDSEIPLFWSAFDDVCEGALMRMILLTRQSNAWRSSGWLPTLVEIAGGAKGNELKTRIEAGQYPGIVKTTLDGVNQIDYLTGRSEKSARDTFFYYSGKDPSAVRYKNWKMYFAMVSDAPAGFTVGVVPYHWTQVVHIKRDPFEISIGSQYKTLMGVGGAIAGPVTAYQYDWNMLPIGQALWLKELESYIPFPPLQNPASYNLEQVKQQVREMKTISKGGE